MVKTVDTGIMSALRKAELESFNSDKCVKDNIVESWLCVDCGVNTAPGLLDGPATRIDLALNGKSRQRYDRDTEVYSLKKAVWKRTGVRAWGGCLCISCLEERLGRRLHPRDFDQHDRIWHEMPSTERLRSRRGLRGKGPVEMVLVLEGGHIRDWSSS
jgi:hypothetical protein